MQKRHREGCALHVASAAMCSPPQEGQENIVLQMGIGNKREERVIKMVTEGKLIAAPSLGQVPAAPSAADQSGCCSVP